MGFFGICIVLISIFSIGLSKNNSTVKKSAITKQFSCRFDTQCSFGQVCRPLFPSWSARKNCLRKGFKGEACHEDSDCSGSYVCGSNLKCKENTFCRFDAQCSPPNVCRPNNPTFVSNKKCQPKGGIGAPCHENSDCIGSYLCGINFKCIGKYFCRFDNQCGFDKVCRPTNPTWNSAKQCLPKGPIGAACHESSDCSGSYVCGRNLKCNNNISCKTDLQCGPPKVCRPINPTWFSTKQCQQKGFIGDTCHENADCRGSFICGTNLRCTNQLFCTFDTQCNPPQVCRPIKPSWNSRKKCLPKGFVGASCYENTDCNGNLVCGFNLKCRSRVFSKASNSSRLDFEKNCKKDSECKHPYVCRKWHKASSMRKCRKKATKGQYCYTDSHCWNHCVKSKCT